MTDNAPRSVTSADLLAELRHEQQSFRFLMMAMTAILGLAAIIAAGSVLYFFLQLQGLKQDYAEQAELSQINFRIVEGKASRQRESTQAAIVAIREEAAAARQQAELAQEIRTVTSVREAARYKDQALEIARGQFLGSPMNEVTAQLVSVVLKADGTQRPLLSDGERVLLTAALDDWGGQKPERVRAGMEALLADSEALEDKAMGAAGLAMLEYRAANDNSLGWNNGCSDVNERVTQAEGFGLKAPMLLLWNGQCLRKRGDSLNAYRAFREAAALIETEAAEVTLQQEQMAHHGVGTTLVALVASEQLPDARAPGDALLEALTELKVAARIRADRGATAVGVAYTEENIGFIHLLYSDWPLALEHTERIDEIVPLAWNLTVRHIAARENEAALREAGASRTSRELMQTIQRESAQMLKLLDCGGVDKPELKRLLNVRYDGVVDDLTAHCEVEAAANL